MKDFRTPGNRHDLLATTNKKTKLRSYNTHRVMNVALLLGTLVAAAFAMEAPSWSRIKEGDRVTITGLVSQPKYNGKSGEVTGYDKAAGRWKVLLNEGYQLSLKEANLRDLVREPWGSRVQTWLEGDQVVRLARPHPSGRGWSAGSGLFVYYKGDFGILTNNHVIPDFDAAAKTTIHFGFVDQASKSPFLMTQYKVAEFSFGCDESAKQKFCTGSADEYAVDGGRCGVTSAGNEDDWTFAALCPATMQNAILNEAIPDPYILDAEHIDDIKPTEKIQLWHHKGGEARQYTTNECFEREVTLPGANIRGVWIQASKVKAQDRHLLEVRPRSHIGFAKRHDEVPETESSTGQGSSGCPIFNMRGRLVGIYSYTSMTKGQMECLDKVSGNPGRGGGISIDHVLNGLDKARAHPKLIAGSDMLYKPPYGDSVAVSPLGQRCKVKGISQPLGTVDVLPKAKGKAKAKAKGKGKGPESDVNPGDSTKAVIILCMQDGTFQPHPSKAGQAHLLKVDPKFLHPVSP